MSFFPYLRHVRLFFTKVVHRHQQHHVQLGQCVFQHVQRRGGVEHQAGLAAAFLDQADGAVDVLGRLRVEGDVGFRISSLRPLRRKAWLRVCTRAWDSESF